MPKFRKKPVEIEAVQYDGSLRSGDEVTAWADASLIVQGEDLIVRTLEGDLTVSPGDWVIRGVKGEFYPCKPDIFEATYDAV